MESYPAYAARILRSKFENVPDVTPPQADAKAAAAQAILDAALKSDPTQVLRGFPPDRQRDLALRLIVSADAEPDRLYVAGDGADVFERTASRLAEMRSDAYKR